MGRNCLLHVHTETETGFRFETETGFDKWITPSVSRGEVEPKILESSIIFG